MAGRILARRPAPEPPPDPETDPVGAWLVYARDEIRRLRFELAHAEVMADHAALFARWAIRDERNADAQLLAATLNERDALRARCERLDLDCARLERVAEGRKRHAEFMEERADAVRERVIRTAAALKSLYDVLGDDECPHTFRQRKHCERCDAAIRQALEALAMGDR